MQMYVRDLIHNMFDTCLGALLFCVIQKGAKKIVCHVLKELVFAFAYAVILLIICGKP